MAEKSPKHGLTRTVRGWVKRVNGRLKWVVASSVCPTGDLADEYYERHFSRLWAVHRGPVEGDGASVKYACDCYYDRKSRAGIDPRTLADHLAAMKDFADCVGRETLWAKLGPADFAKVRAAWSARFGPDRLAKFMATILGLCRWVSGPPLRLAVADLGDEFEKPTRADFRRDRKASAEEHGRKLFDAEEIAKVFAKAGVNLRAMILLALNGGFGNTDVAKIPLKLAGDQWLDYARGKTGIDRRCPLWPETVQAIRSVLANRKKISVISAEASSLLFATRQGSPYIFDFTGESGTLQHNDRVSKSFATACHKAGVVQHGRGFYSLRRTFRTLVDDLGDDRATRLIMGHADTTMGGVYVQRIADERLLRIVDHVRKQLKISSMVVKQAAKLPMGRKAAGKPSQAD